MPSRALDFPVFDVDNHMYETPAAMTKHIDPKFKGVIDYVDVEGRTYYGCCPMCKERLNMEPAVRIARDPVSGEDVDKAKAVIVKDASGKILYFASEDTLRRYRG